MWLTRNGYEIHQVLKGRSNSFLVVKGNSSLLVDTGRKTRRAALTERIDNYKGVKPVALVLTHAHFDHAENAAYLRQKYQIPVIIHQNEAGYLSKGENPPIRGSFFLTRFFTNVWEERLKIHFRYDPCPFDLTVDQKYNLDNLGFDAYLLHTPGHSPGSMSLIVDHEVAIVGDAMFGIIKKLIYPPFADDPEEMIRSWGKLLDTGCRIYLPAHGTQNSRNWIERQYIKYMNRS